MRKGYANEGVDDIRDVYDDGGDNSDREEKRAEKMCIIRFHKAQSEGE